MKIKTFIINLKEAVSRKEQILKDTAVFPFMDVELIEAVDGRKLSEEELGELFDIGKFRKRYYRLPGKGEIGCTLSHRLCYRKLLASSYPYALILEDDAQFLVTEHTEHFIGQGARLLDEGAADVILFAWDVLYFNRPKELGLGYSAYPLCEGYGTYAYMVNRKFAELLAKEHPATMVADDYEAAMKQGVKVMCVGPNIIGVDLSGSTIDEERRNIKSYTDKTPFWIRAKQRIRAKYRRYLKRRGILIKGW